MGHEKTILIESDAFSSGQINSKIWLCEELEKILISNDRNYHIELLAGWVGVLAFLMFSRKNIKIKKFHLLDINKLYIEKALTINETWVNSNQFFATIADINFRSYHSDVVINTSVEHFYDNRWFDNISSESLIVLQSNDMINIDDHVNCFLNIDSFKKAYPMSNLLFEGTKTFTYPNFSFNRFMLIGYK